MIVCRKSTGPMSGISRRTGIGIRSNRGGSLASRRWARAPGEYRKLVSPVTSTFSTTPTMTWSTRYLIAKAPSTKATSMPATMAATRPAHGDPVIEATMAAANAPTSSWPSIAMLTTPDALAR